MPFQKKFTFDSEEEETLIQLIKDINNDDWNLDKTAKFKELFIIFKNDHPSYSGKSNDLRREILNIVRRKSLFEKKSTNRQIWNEERLKELINIGEICKAEQDWLKYTSYFSKNVVKK